MKRPGESVYLITVIECLTLHTLFCLRNSKASIVKVSFDLCVYETQSKYLFNISLIIFKKKNMKKILSGVDNDTLFLVTNSKVSYVNYRILTNLNTDECLETKNNC